MTFFNKYNIEFAIDPNNTVNECIVSPLPFPNTNLHQNKALFSKNVNPNEVYALQNQSSSSNEPGRY